MCLRERLSCTTNCQSPHPHSFLHEALGTARLPSSPSTSRPATSRVDASPTASTAVSPPGQSRAHVSCPTCSFPGTGIQALATSPASARHIHSPGAPGRCRQRSPRSPRTPRVSSGLSLRCSHRAGLPGPAQGCGTSRPALRQPSLPTVTACSALSTPSPLCAAKALLAVYRTDSSLRSADTGHLLKSLDGSNCTLIRIRVSKLWGRPVSPSPVSGLTPGAGLTLSPGLRAAGAETGCRMHGRPGENTCEDGGAVWPEHIGPRRPSDAGGRAGAWVGAVSRQVHGPGLSCRVLQVPPPGLLAGGALGFPAGGCLHAASAQRRGGTQRRAPSQQPEQGQPSRGAGACGCLPRRLVSLEVSRRVPLSPIRPRISVPQHSILSNTRPCFLLN